MGLFEIFEIDDEVRRMINENLDFPPAAPACRELGIRTLREDGVRKVLAGLTSPEEVLNVTMGDANDFSPLFILLIMDTNLTLELFIGRGMIDKSLAKDIKEEMIASGKELPEVLADFGIIGSKDDIWQMIASDLGTEFITLDNFQPYLNVQNMYDAGHARAGTGGAPCAARSGRPVRLPGGSPESSDGGRPSFALGQDLDVLVAPDHQISERINELYGGESAAMSDLMQELNNMQVNNETEDSSVLPLPSSALWTSSLHRPSRKRPPTFTSNLLKATSKSATVWTAPCMKCSLPPSTCPYRSFPASRSWQT